MSSISRPPTPPARSRTSAASLFFGGLLPLIAFTVIEEYYGPRAGLMAGLSFGLGEVIYEKWKFKKVSKITWFGNILLFVFGLISLWTEDGVWFKLQPAILEGSFTLMLWGSLILKKNLLATLIKAQGGEVPPALNDRLTGLAFRCGFFFALHAGMATWAAFYWSTTAWVFLKGIGLTVSFVLYLLIEGLWLRRSIRKSAVDSTRGK